MTMPVEELLNTLALMKAGVIHHDYAFSFKTWNKCELAPVIEYMTIDVLLKVIQGKQHLFIQSTNNIGSLFCLPVVTINTRSTNGCLAIRTNSFSFEATFVPVNNGIALLR